MQDDDVAFGDVQFLTGSPQRRNVLKALCEEPARPHELCADIDATRTTIQRILAGFRERQWVVKYDGDYRPTVTGRRICQQYEALLGELRLAREFGPLAAHLGPVANDLPIEALERGQLTVSDEGSPLAEAGAPVGESIIVTSLGGERTHTATALGEALRGTSGGDTVTVVWTGRLVGAPETRTDTLATVPL